MNIVAVFIAILALKRPSFTRTLVHEEDNNNRIQL